MEKKSEFVGGILPYLGWTIVAIAITTITFGIALPWAICILETWKAENTILEGHRLKFDGTGMGLFGNWIKWWFFSVITLGIYALWIPIKIEQWRVSHTHFAD